MRHTVDRSRATCDLGPIMVRVRAGPPGSLDGDNDGTRPTAGGQITRGQGGDLPDDGDEAGRIDSACGRA